MILHQAITDQTVDRTERGKFIKELVVVHVRDRSPEPSPDEDSSSFEIYTQNAITKPATKTVPLAMIRKRCATLDGTIASVLLIHGYGQNRYAWHLPSRSFSNYLAQAGFDVFNLDLRGHGRSRHLGARRPGHVIDFVQDDIPAAIAEIQRISGVRPIYLIGHSLGGLVSYAASTSLHHVVGGIVTLGSPYLFTRGSWPLTLLGHMMLEVDRRVSLGHGAFGLKGLAETMRLARVFIESPLFPLPIRGFCPGSVEPTILSQHMSLAMDNGSITVLRNMFLDAAEARKSGHRLGNLYGYAERFEALDIPLLVISGSRDDLAPPASVEPAFQRSRSSDKLYRTYPRGHLDLLVGHETPHTIWPLIASWLRTRSRKQIENEE